MGYTNKTTHYELPQYVATDKPKYLTDFNETMVAIDTQMYVNAQAAATADGKAVAAKDTADGAVSSIGTLNVQINGDPENPTDTGLAGDVSGIDTDLNTVQSLIGSGTPTTSNQTIIGAINSIEATLAPAEDNATLGASYETGEQFARGGSLYTALTDLTAGTAFTSLTLNTDYKLSDSIVKQLTDAKNEYKGFLGIYSTSGTVEVTADGVKDYDTLLTELLAAANDVFESIPTDEAFGITALASSLTGICSINREVIRAGGTHILNNLIFGAVRAYTNKIRVEAVTMGPTNFSSIADIDGTGVSYTNELSNVPAADTKITLYYNKYYKIGKTPT